MKTEVCASIHALKGSAQKVLESSEKMTRVYLLPILRLELQAQDQPDDNQFYRLKITQSNKTNELRGGTYSQSDSEGGRATTSLLSPHAVNRAAPKKGSHALTSRTRAYRINHGKDNKQHV